ncbi:MAG: TonB family protein [Pseudomonadota bacterium]
MIKKLRYCFLLVLLLHLLLFLSFTVVLIEQDQNTPPEQDEESKAQKVLPSYVYQEQPPPAPQNSPAEKPSLLNPTTDNTAKNGILKPKAAPPKQPAAAATPTTMIGKPSKTQSGAPHSDPANLIADKPTDKPLIKLLSRATGAKLFYPKSAQDFHITGIVRIQFYITPEGVVSQIVLLQSSGSSQLDEAGLYAISNISPVKGVDVYLKKPRTLTVGIIFG